MNLRTPYRMVDPIPDVPPRPEPGKAALIVLDAQAAFWSDDTGLFAAARDRGVTREFDEYREQLERAARNLRQLLPVAREAQIPVVWASRSSLGLAVDPGEPSIADDAVCEALADVVDEQDCFVVRPGISLFTDPGAREALASTTADTLILAGALANFTVAVATLEALSLGYHVVIPIDCCASESVDWQDVFRLQVHGGRSRIVTTRELVEILRGSRT